MDEDAITTGFGKEKVDDSVRILRDGENTLIVLCNQGNAMTLKPSIGVVIVKAFEESFHQTMPSRIDLREVAYRGEGVGAVTPSTT